jgi:hypothetical protein
MEKCIPLGSLAQTRIGIQPLARSFYILETGRLHALGVPKRYARPLLLSPRTVTTAVVRPETIPTHYILFVKQAKEQIRNKALRLYIQAAEQAVVPIRGKDEVVVGYHNLPRLMQTGRSPWYNLVDEIHRRGRFPVLVPRRFYENFLVVWNKAGAVPNENFIEVKPKQKADLLVLLGILNTSFFELVCRSRGQQYGGGVFNLNPLDVQELPILNPELLENDARKAITEAYKAFTESQDRNGLDKAVAESFCIGSEQLRQIQHAVLQGRRLSLAAKRITQLV